MGNFRECEIQADDEKCSDMAYFHSEIFLECKGYDSLMIMVFQKNSPRYKTDEHLTLT